MLGKSCFAMGMLRLLMYLIDLHVNIRPEAGRVKKIEPALRALDKHRRALPFSLTRLIRKIPHGGDSFTDNVQW